MTREEAHTLLEVMATNLTGELMCSGHLTTKQTKLLAKKLEAVNVAIEALSANPSGDLISREDAMEAVCSDCCWHNTTSCDGEAWDCDSVNKIRNLSSVDITETKTCQRCQELTDTILNRQGKRIKELEALAEAVQGWIPTKERLPNKDGYYLVCMNWDYNNMGILIWTDGWNCIRHTNGKVDRTSEIDGEDIVAWMWLPEPYKGGGVG